MSGHGHIDGSNKKVALLIAVLALFLAFAETLAKSAQTSALSDNIEASNLWAFFQAKTVRITVVRTASEAASLSPPSEATRSQIDTWGKNAARWDSEPETGEGRRELSQRAKSAEARRDLALARYHHFELGSAAFQVGIVLASATVITGIAALAYLGIALGFGGLAMVAIGLFAPGVHLF